MKESKNKKGIIIGIVSALVLVVILGVSYAFYNYSLVGQNQILVAGDVYMKFKEKPALTIENALPSEGPGEKYFEFTIEGKNTYNKTIWYEIDLQYGEEPNAETGRTERIKDSLLKFRLVEIKGEEEQTVVDNASYTDLTNKKIWVNTIPANTQNNIEITYRLYMWVSSETVIGNTSDKDYDMDEWEKVYASIKVNVMGDFEEKELTPEPVIATKKIKDTVGKSGGITGLDPTTGEVCSNGECKEYRYSGPSVNNYIYFNCSDKTTYKAASTNCELWRILGIFKDDSGNEHLKIVRDNVLTRDMFPAEYKIGETTYKIQYTGDSVYWYNNVGGGSNNDWTIAGLQYWLNTTQDETAEQPNKGYLSYIKGDSISMIADMKYYLGTVTLQRDGNKSGIKDIPKEAYVNERAVSGCADGVGPTINAGEDLTFEETPTCRVWANNQATWTGKVALLYPSDYGFSASSDNWETQLKSFNTISESSWLQKTANRSGAEWFLSPTSGGLLSVTRCYIDGIVTTSNTVLWHAVRPTLYLTSNVQITSGDGTSEKPYFLEI